MKDLIRRKVTANTGQVSDINHGSVIRTGITCKKILL